MEKKLTIYKDNTIFMGEKIHGINFFLAKKILKTSISMDTC